MYEIAKKAREAMKGKARKLAGEKDQKVDSSDWSPAEPLNADVKTGLRPISRRAYKKGGKVEGAACGPTHMGRKARKSGGKVTAKEMVEEKSEAKEYAKAKTNRDVKAANEDREGIKHIGGMKKGGRAKKADGGKMSADELREAYKKGKERADAMSSDERRRLTLDAIDKRQNHKALDEMGRKSGGRAKKAQGGETLQEERGRTRFGMPTPRDHGAKGPVPGELPAKKDEGHIEPGTPEDYARMRRESGDKYKKGGRAKKMDGGQLDRMVSPEMRRRIERGTKTPTVMPKNPPLPPRRPAEPVGGEGTEPVGLDKDQVRRMERGYKRGGEIPTTLAGQKKVQKEQAAASEPHRGKAQHYKKGGRAEKMGGGAADPRMDIVKKNAMNFGSGAQGSPYKKGGRTGKLSGGALASGLMGGLLPAMSMGIMGKDEEKEGKKGGGRVARKAGGRTKAKGKTNINIVIAAGKPATPDMMQGPGGPPMPPPGVPVPLPGGAPGGMPMGAPMGGMPMPPAPPAMPMPPGGPMGRKAGGRVAKQIGGGFRVAPGGMSGMGGGMGVPGGSASSMMGGMGGMRGAGPSPMAGMGKPAGMMGGMGAPADMGRAMGASPMAGMGKPVGMMGGAPQAPMGAPPVMPQMAMPQFNSPEVQQALPNRYAAAASAAYNPDPTSVFYASPMPRKSGGRVAKVASSYKDMEAGAGSGEGRLQKTDIAKTGKGAPTYKRGGKVYRSYKDMDAGAGSGEGRLEKTEIQSRKR